MKWRCTALTRADGHLVEDDWCLQDASGRPLARIYKVKGGPRDGQWFWAVQVDAEGRPFNGRTGHADTGREARAACEARMRFGRGVVG